MTLLVMLEERGQEVLVGRIEGTGSQDARFVYDPDYQSQPEHRPISIALPFSEEPYSPEKTRCFFDGLLPEGYTRRCVASEMHVDAQDYISILEKLGDECLGAIRIVKEGEKPPMAAYQEMPDDLLKRFAMEGATESAALVAKSHLSLTGASGKAGLYFSYSEKKWYLPVGSAPSTHIVKQSHVRLDKIVTNEQLCLKTAEKLGMDVPESFVVSFYDEGEKDESSEKRPGESAWSDDKREKVCVLFATRRYDRKFSADSRNLNGIPVPYRLHQEDFAQALGIPSAFKYEKPGDRYLEKMFRLLRNYSANPLEDTLKLWDICIFNYLIGNTDNHIKNLSLLYSEDRKKIRLAPAYDIVSTLIYESSTDEMSLGINGAYNIWEITGENFKKEARNVGLGVGIAMEHYDRMHSEFENALAQSAEELCAQGFSEASGTAREILEVFKKRY
ncbi:MAG: type II toxin-antitoxin system HipA family toxin [Lachnospiraceae bacterium]|nr:type II toxin-antitoxin system HipA family toxin [Lachnospiraceae bacterium]